MSKAIIVYATASGNTEWVVDNVQVGMMRENLDVVSKRVEKTTIEELYYYDLVILASPTYQVGKLQEYFEPFYYEFIKQNFNERKFAAIALGKSKSYDEFCGAAKYLEDGIKKVNGTLVLPVLKIDDMPQGREEEWENWGQSLAKEFNK